VRKRSPHHYCCLMHGWHYISMHNSLNIFWFCQKLSWRGEELLSMNTFFNTSLCSWLGTGIFTWRKVRLNKVLYMKMLRKRCLKTNFCPGKSLKSPWFCSTKRCMNPEYGTCLNG
jgi:hypothetical protein